MKKIHKNKSSKKALKIVLTAAVIFYFSFTFISQQITIAHLKQNSEQISQKISEQNEKKEKIESEMQKQNELERIEKVARDKLGFLRDNERVFVDSSSR